MAKKNVVPLKKRFQPNMSWLILLFIIGYLVFLCYGFFHKSHISIYEVNTSDISDDSPLYGFILRDETVYNTDSEGYINYYHAEGSRIGAGEVVYTVDSNGEVSSMLDELRSAEQTSESISAMRNAIAGYHTNFSLSEYSGMEDLHYNVNDVMFEQNNGTLYSDLNKALRSAGKSKDFKKVVTKKSGVVSYSVDGYETIKQADINAELISQYNKATRQQIQTKDIVKSGSPVYKLVNSNEWQLIVPLSEDYYNTLKEMSVVRVTIDKDGISFNSPIELFDQDGIHFVKLSTARFMERYINDRFLRVEFNVKSASGLKIPNSSILEKDYYVLPESVITKGESGNGVLKQLVDDESGTTTKKFVPLGNYFVRDGKYYVSSSVASANDILLNSEDESNYIVGDKETLKGVYCVNQGYCEFRVIDVLYQNSEYTIVSDKTDMGLATYDHIVVDPTGLSDDDFIEN